MTKPLDMTDTEIFEWLDKEEVFLDRSTFKPFKWAVYKITTENTHLICSSLSIRQAVCQAAAILKEKK